MCMLLTVRLCKFWRELISERPPVCRYRARVLTVTSVNVNGLRAAAKKGFVEWLAETSADVLCLQEVRAEPEQLPEAVRAPEGWYVTHAPAAAKGRAGVSLYTRREPDAVRVGFVDGRYVVNPTYEQRRKSRIDLIVAGHSDAIVMVEAGSKEFTEEEMVGSL